MGPSQAPVVAFSAKLTPSGADVAAMSNRSGEFGRCCADMQNVQITTAGMTFGTLARANMPPLKLYQTDRSVHSLHPLLNYHASAPSVRADLELVWVCLGLTIGILRFIAIYFKIVSRHQSHQRMAGTRAPGDQGTRGSRDQRTRGPGNSKTKTFETLHRRKCEPMPLEGPECSVLSQDCLGASCLEFGVSWMARKFLKFGD